jgi:hypothetical protein
MNKKLDPQKYSRWTRHVIGEAIALAVEGYVMQCTHDDTYMFSGTFADFMVRYKVEFIDEDKKVFDIIEATVYVTDQFFLQAEHERLVKYGGLIDIQQAEYEPLIAEFELTPRDGGLKQWTGTILK